MTKYKIYQEEEWTLFTVCNIREYLSQLCVSKYMYTIILFWIKIKFVRNGKRKWLENASYRDKTSTLSINQRLLPKWISFWERKYDRAHSREYGTIINSLYNMRVIKV